MALALAAGVALPAAGCGGGNKGSDIPQADAARIINRLEEAARRGAPDAFRCNDLKHDSIPALRALIGALPPDTKSNIKNTLNDGVDHLNDLVSQECNARQTTTETQPSTTSTQTTQSTTTETTPTTNTETKPNTNTNTNTNTTTTPPPGGGTPSPTDTSGASP